MSSLKIKKSFLFYFVSILMVMFVGAMDKIMTFPMMIVSAIFAIMLANVFVKRKSVDMCKGIVLLLMFQNLSIGLGAHMFSNMDSTLKYVTQIPFIVIFVIWIFTELNNIHMNKIERTSVAFYMLLVCIFLSLIIGRGNILSILINLRNMTVFYMIYVIGKSGIRNYDDLKCFVTFTIKLAIFFLIVGIIILFLGYDCYKVIGIKEVYIAKGLTNISDKLDGRFYTTLISKQYERMGSLLYEPVNLAYFYAIVSLLAIYCDWTRNKKRKLCICVLCFIGLILTFGKGGYMIFGVSIGAYLFRGAIKKLSAKINEPLIFKFTVLIIVVVVTIFCVFYYRNVGAAVMPHFWGIQRTWKSVQKRPYGYGLGTGGNAAQTFGAAEGEWLESGGETALMSFMYQIGIQGVIMLIVTLINMTNFPKENKNKYIEKLFILFNYVVIILIGVSLLQDNTFTPQCIAIYMIVLGGLKNINTLEITSTSKICENS